MEAIISPSVPHVPWNKGKLTGQKSPLKLKEIWAIRIRLQLGGKTRDLAMFNLAIDSKLRACDLAKLRARCLHGHSCSAPRDCHAAEDAAAGPIRDHRANAGKRGKLDQGSWAVSLRLSVLRPDSRVTSSLNSSVREDRASLDKIDRAR
jgi:hypothetical protein